MRRLAPILLAILVAFLPALADARPGSGLSFGSRGGRTYSSVPRSSVSPGGAAPVQNSITPNSGYGSQAQSGFSPGYGSGGFGGLRPRSSFTSGLIGGLVGAGIGGMLFGRGFFGGMHGGGGILGLLLQLFLLYLLASWAYRRFFAGAPAMAGGGWFARGMQPGPRPGPGRSAGIFGGARPQRPVNLAPADYQAFDGLLHNIQAAWTAHDLNALRAMTTPEIAATFAEQLAEQTSRGVRNAVTDVRLLQGNLSEAWSEGPRDYATVAMRFSMVDVTRDASGRVVDGSSSERVTVTEVWTFLRVPGGRWVLSAIQQGR